MRPEDDALLAGLREQIADGEVLRWHGRPGTRRTGIETFAMPGLLAVAGSAVIGLNGAGPRTPGFGLTEPGVLAATAAFVWLCRGRLQRWRDLYRTVYGITDRRLLIVRTGWSAQVVSESIPHPLVELRRRFRGRATVRMTTRLYKVEPEGDHDGGWLHYHIEPIDIADPARPFALLRG